MLLERKLIATFVVAISVHDAKCKICRVKWGIARSYGAANHVLTRGVESQVSITGVKVLAQSLDAIRHEKKICDPDIGYVVIRSERTRCLE